MGKQPSVIIIARHGARLDAADKSWHLSSPTPYDPPLTYGGWTQSRALGLRIASLLHTLADEASADALKDVNNGQKPGPARRKKYKVFIHSSPFLRCTQTSVGISAGISQYRGMIDSRERSESRPRSASAARPSPRLHAVDVTAEELAAKRIARNARRHNIKDHRTTLRVDAFLGEWLSPDYFDLITPPPKSSLMVAGAKGELHRRADELDPYASTYAAKRGSQGSLWGSARAAESDPTLLSTDGPLDLKQLSHTLPGRNRTSSYSAGRITPFGRPGALRGKSGERSPSMGYHPPTPSYAVSPSDHIPKGYVAHARDACVEVDFAWDSSREPLEWGDGGEYGEEWSAMHKRFRKGLGSLIEWYDHHGIAHISDDEEAVPAVEDEEELSDDEEIAVVMVTHGAGCNALLGALTEQPVLIDVPMAAVSVAVRKPVKADANGYIQNKRLSPVQSPSPGSSPEIPGLPRRSSSRAPGLSALYEMKLVASSDHLRAGADPTRPMRSNTSSPVMSASATVPDSRRRGTLSYTTPDAGWSLNDAPRGTTVSAALGSIRRMSTTQNVPPQRSNSKSGNTATTGLWSPISPSSTQANLWEQLNGQPQTPSGANDVDENKLGIQIATAPVEESAPLATIHSHNSELDPNAADIPSINAIAPTPSKESFDTVAELPTQPPPISIGRTLSQKGLWGSAPNGIQARGPKRRWTVQQE